jgi:hypothetical protein
LRRLCDENCAFIEYVRICSVYGTGFFCIPNTETCLRVLRVF